MKLYYIDIQTFKKNEGWQRLSKTAKHRYHYAFITEKKGSKKQYFIDIMIN